MLCWESSWFGDVHFTATAAVGAGGDDVLGGLLLAAGLGFQGIGVGGRLGNADRHLAGEGGALFDIQIGLTFRDHVVSLHGDIKSE